MPEAQRARPSSRGVLRGPAGAERLSSVHAASKHREGKGPEGPLTFLRLGQIRSAAVVVVMMFSPPAMTGRGVLHTHRSERHQGSQDQDHSRHATLPSLIAPEHVTTVRVTWPVANVQSFDYLLVVLTSVSNYGVSGLSG
jgi:hypothetical protein